jgi:hypothetical protein
VKSRSWYRIALAMPTGAPQLVLASGEHAGEALASATKELAGSWAIAFDLATTEEIPLGESVGKGHVVRIGDAPAGLATFRFPIGVLPAVSGGVTSIASGWIERRDPQLLVIEAQTEADHLIDLYLGLI